MQSLKHDIVLNCVDEAHVSLPSQWGREGMREEMNIAPSYLRAQVQATTKAPTLAMTASAKVKGKHSEVEEIKEMCSVQYSPTTIISISPVLHNHIYVNVKKPPATSGFYGKNCYSFSPQKIGSVHVLWRLYLKQFVSDIESGRKPKRAILYVKSLQDLTELDDFLTLKLLHVDSVRDQNLCPWVTFSSSTGKLLYLHYDTKNQICFHN